MTKPRIEEMAQEYREIEKTRPWWNKLKEALEQKDKYNYSTVDAIDLKFAIEDYQRLHHQLQKAHQAGIDEAVEVVWSLRVKEVHDKLCDGYCETWSCPWPNSRERNRTLDDTIKALTDNK